MDASAAAQLRRLGGDPDGFTGRALQDEYVARADLVLTATTLHRVAVLREVPQALRRTFTLLEFAHLVEAVPAVRAQWGRPADLVAAASAARGSATLTEYDVEDPYGRDEVVQPAGGRRDRASRGRDQCVTAVVTLCQQAIHSLKCGGVPALA